jgi:integrase
MAIRLTKRAIEQLLPGQKTGIHYDADLKGFGLRITPTGARAWIVEYRPNGGGRRVATKRMTLGSVGTLTPEEARRRAREVLAEVRLGADPAGLKARQREAPNLAEIAKRFLADQVGHLRPRTLVNYELYFRRYAVPQLGASKITAITVTELARLHRSIGREKPITANRVLRAVSSVFAYAEENGYVQRGQRPTSGIKLYSEENRERFLSTLELERLGAALRLAETEGLPWRIDGSKPRSKHTPTVQRTVIDPFAAAAIRLLLLTGCRLREILHLRWSDIDFERGLLFLPSSKTGRRAVVLNGPAIAVFDALPRLGPLVIAGRNPIRPRADLNKPWAALKRHAELGDTRLHDLRHSFASFGAGAGLGLPIIGKLLGHAKAATTDRYAHLDAAPLRRASERIAGAIATALGPTDKSS